ncbi:General transcription factor 3C polypeptide 3 [Picochlorum sp. SENEW3]|nr:General transcription factor 3C polypeptide 3 [Picochlorum sp. SENEW3]WPT14930.1 General transcription factor 3C polypeptide 3 [Picochlorum sp. SENEW3]
MSDYSPSADEDEEFEYLDGVSEEEDMEVAGGEEGEEGEDEDEDGFDILNFLDDQDDIPTAIAALGGMANDSVLENMRRRGLQHNTREQDGPRTRRTSRSVRFADEDLSAEEEPEDLEEEPHAYKVDKWSDEQAEQLGFAPPTSTKAQKRREQARVRKMAEGRVVRDRSGMPEVAKDLLGKGNTCFFRAEYDEAEKIFMNCIRIAPEFPDAYSSLSSLFAEKGDHTRAMNFLMVAAHLTKKESQIWKDAAVMSRSQGALRQAVYCLNQVIRREKNDLEWRYERGLILKDLNMERKALEDLMYYHDRCPDDPENIKTITRLLYSMDRLDDARNAIQSYIETYPETTDLTHINLLSELYMHPDIRDWNALLGLMEETREAGWADPQDLPTELESKEAIAYAHLGDVEKASAICQKLLEKPVDIFPDVFIYVATEFEALQMYDYAVPFLERLACEAHGSSMDVWRRYANACQQAEGGIQGAIEACTKVVQRVSRDNPDFIDAVIRLADLLLENGQIEEAKSSLAELESVDPYPGGVLTIPEHVYTTRSRVLKACECDDLYSMLFYEPVLKSLKLIFHSPDNVERKGRKKSGDGGDKVGNDLFVWESSQEKRRKKAKQQDGGVEEPSMFGADMEESDVNIPVLSNPLKDNQCFDVVVHLIKVLLKQGEIEKAHDICDLAVTVLSKKHPNKDRRDTVKMYLADCQCRMGDLSSALKHIKAPADHWPDSAEVWNIFTKITLGVGGVRQTSKYISNMRRRHPHSLALALLNGHVFLQSHQYAAALGEYFDAYRMGPWEPVVKMCIANLFVNYACVTKKDRDMALMHAFAWMQEYAKLRKNNVEFAYNAGRIAHQFSLLHLAVPLYKEALMHHDHANLPFDMEQLEIERNAFNNGHVSRISHYISKGSLNPKKSDLSRESAFNLALLLRESGAHELAKKCMKKYLVF